MDRRRNRAVAVAAVADDAPAMVIVQPMHMLNHSLTAMWSNVINGDYLIDSVDVNDIDDVAVVVAVADAVAAADDEQ